MANLLPTAFSRLEAKMAASYAQRADGWPVGPEQITGRGWYCTTPTVQLIEQPRDGRKRRFVVHTFFPFRRTDRRYPPSDPMTLDRARRFAMQRLHCLAGRQRIRPGCGRGIEWVRGGDHIGMEVFR